MSSRKPMSSIRSTSSSTTKRHVVEVDDPAIEQVDHAARRADDDLRAVLEELHLRGDLLSAVNRGPIGSACTAPRRLISASTCTASSRVGTRMIACVASPWSARWRMGMPKAAVLPVPVRAWPRMSTPVSALGISSAWISEGVSNFASASRAEKRVAKSKCGESFGDGRVFRFVGQENCPSDRGGEVCGRITLQTRVILSSYSTNDSAASTTQRDEAGSFGEYASG